MPKDELYRHLPSVADTEIDLLIEDADYFMFVEVKNPPPWKKAKFAIANGAHQPVRQYFQGKILERLIKKEFILATVGAGLPGHLKPNDLEKSLLAVVGTHTAELYVCNLSCDVFDRKA